MSSLLNLGEGEKGGRTVAGLTVKEGAWQELLCSSAPRGSLLRAELRVPSQ